ncbi:MAG: efflux RND transporter permease subunit, partial [Thiovulaceae bacterium]|nr:efflux RND transporter permease subunit [Sulfurimonadaceae bacterium]
YISPYLSVEYDPNVLIRKKYAVDIADDLKKVIEPLKDVKVNDELLFEELVVKVPGAGVVANDFEVSLSSKSNKDILAAIAYLEEELKKINGISNISNDANIGEMELKLRVNEYGQELGFNEQLVSSELRSYYLKGEYGKLFSDIGLLRMKIESNMNEFISSIDTVELQVPNTSQFVALKDICDFIYKQGFVDLKKEDGIRIRSVFASIDKKSITSSEVIARMQGAFKKLENDGFKVDIKGEEKENAKNMKEMMQSAIIAIFLIFITLVWLFDSIKKSLIVISTIPLVLFGVFLGHIIMGINLTMPGMVGIVGLAGVVVNDGLIMVSFIKDATNTEELMKKALTRLRPILLTSITTVLGLSTLIFFASGQAMILQPMAVSLGYGIAWATVLNLVYIPLLYAVLYKIKEPKIQSLDKV